MALSSGAFTYCRSFTAISRNSSFLSRKLRLCVSEALRNKLETPLPGPFVGLQVGFLLGNEPLQFGFFVR